ncbi:DUF4113 domain-containing protein [Bradyrhizobium sp. SZCCHNR1011]|uniref:DUF4113 domain-containing protein n=1 Tax=unclassified Bradyrhizobium TaxID=2631580 RepID=UPI0039676F43
MPATPLYHDHRASRGQSSERPVAYGPSPQKNRRDASGPEPWEQVARRPLDRARPKALMKAIDGLNEYYGREALAHAAAGRSKAWKLRRDVMSRAIRKNWSELLLV